MTNRAISQQGQQHRFDVVVIGSGIAGLSYILEFLKQAPETNIALISKKKLRDCNSYYAQGGIAAASGESESMDRHMQDTLAAGKGLTSKTACEKLLGIGPQVIQDLTRHGVNFDSDLALEGGHSERRIHHVGDYTGKSIIEALLAQLKQYQQVSIFEGHTAVNLITAKIDHKTRVMGAYVLNQDNEKIDSFIADAIVLATGGAGKIYQYTSNTNTATGDGIAMAHRAGVDIKHMEFYQFHPTLLYHEKLNNFLISEALRGEGAHLLRPDNHHRFMAQYSPQQEIATRDIVARAIFNEIDNSHYPFVYLDIRHKGTDFSKNRFPNIYRTLRTVDIDMGKHCIPVVPAAHYLCGGIVSTESGRTNLKGLYAIGETACTGLHGANRLASNSLLEGGGMARYAAEDSVHYIKHNPLPHIQVPDWDSHSAAPTRRRIEIDALWRGIRAEMTSYAGIIRHGDELQELIPLIKTRRQLIERHYWQHLITTELLEARNILLVAELVVQSALKRKESLGGHYRSDYPPSIK